MQSLQFYKGCGFEQINAFLRGDKVHFSCDKHIKNIDDSLYFSTIPETTVLFRGVTKQCPIISTSSLYVERGYTSSTMRFTEAVGFSDYGEPKYSDGEEFGLFDEEDFEDAVNMKCCVLSFTVPKNVKIYEFVSADEPEILIQRNLIYSNLQPTKHEGMYSCTIIAGGAEDLIKE